MQKLQNCNWFEIYKDEKVFHPTLVYSIRTETDHWNCFLFYLRGHCFSFSTCPSVPLFGRQASLHQLSASPNTLGQTSMVWETTLLKALLKCLKVVVHCVAKKVTFAIIRFENGDSTLLLFYKLKEKDCWVENKPTKNKPQTALKTRTSTK